MGFVGQLISFFETLFFGSSPEQKVKRELRRLETELKTTPPVLRGGMLQPLVGQALFTLYADTIGIKRILETTIFSESSLRKIRCLDMFMNAAFTEQMRNQLDSLSYEKRKQLVVTDPRAFDNQGQVFDKLLQDIRTKQTFRQIQQLLLAFEQFYDVCCFDYLPYIKLFDRGFLAEDAAYTPAFAEVPLVSLENLLLDLAFISKGLSLTNTFAAALFTLRCMIEEDYITPEAAREEILPHLKRIAAVFSKVLNMETVTALLRISKKDIAFVPPAATYETPYVENYCRWLRSAFDAEKAQIEMEVQNERIAEDLRTLFSGRELVALAGYTDENNELLRQASRPPFLWVLPLETLKTFLQLFFTASVESLLDAVVVEGFFTDQLYQSDFASVLFNCKEIKERLAKFEDSFGRGGEVSQATLLGLIDGSRRNFEDGRQLEILITKYNTLAKKLLDESVHNITALTRKSGEILADFKRSKSEIVSNLKVLFLSARNKEAVETLDKQFPFWLKFIEIMGHYVIIKKSEQLSR